MIQQVMYMKGDIHGAGQVNCYITPSLTCHGDLCCIILVVLVMYMKGDIHGAGQVNYYITPSLTCHHTNMDIVKDM
jgi:hypothetical protein